MIDYEKLKVAHELANKISKERDYTVAIQCAINNECINYMIKAYEIDEQYLYIDDLITKLEELTTPKPKYKEGDFVWYLSNNSELSRMAIDWVREELEINSNQVVYATPNGMVIESALYPSKAALIEAQVVYWTSLKNEVISTRERNMSMTSIHTGDAFNYLNPPFQGLVKGFVAPLKKSNCCGEDVLYCETGWSVSKCSRCGKEYKESCQHESDGMIYRSIPPKNKCKKCGEFY